MSIVRCAAYRKDYGGSLLKLNEKMKRALYPVGSARRKSSRNTRLMLTEILTSAAFSDILFKTVDFQCVRIMEKVF